MWPNFFKDFLNEDRWRFPGIPPYQIGRSLGNPMVDHWERVRAEWMWKRRPRECFVENAFGYLLIIAVSVVVLLIPAIGVFIDAVWLHSCVLLVALDVVRNVCWRRDYETCLCRMIRSIQSPRSI
jgi:hypothetical protein